MREPIPIHIAVEDVLSEVVVKRLLQWSDRQFAVGVTYNRGGFGYLKSNIEGFNNAAKGTPFFVLTDLDRYDCPPALMKDWLSIAKHPNLIFRIAVREVESWLLADRIHFSRFLGVNEKLIPKGVDDNIVDPKLFLLKIAQKSRYSELKKDLLPPINSNRKIGPNYNGRLTEFVVTKWDPHLGQQYSNSLDKAMNAIKKFQYHK
jgi:hypothetical protein